MEFPTKDKDDGLTLFVQKLPPDIKTKEVEDMFSQYGPLSKCFVAPVKEEEQTANAQKKGRIAFVTYALKEDGLEAAQKLDQTQVRSFSISVQPAKSRKELKLEKGPKIIRKKSSKGRKDENVGNKRARLIVRNISFKADENALKEYFEKHGTVRHASLLKREDGKLKGCGFVEFDSVAEASKALKALNASPFLGRPIAVDWAVPKSKFEAVEEDTDDESDSGVGVEEENDVKPDLSEVKVKLENNGEPTEKKKRMRNKKRNRGKKRPKVNEEYDGEEVQNKRMKFEEGEENYDEENEGQEEDEEQEEDEYGEVKVKREKVDQKPSGTSKDVKEGRTVFVTNVPFTIGEDDLAEMMESKFGSIKYAMFCLDSVTQHPKGTAFVQFQTAQAAEKCLAGSEEDLTLEGRRLKVMRAVGREGVEEWTKKKEQEKVKPKADKRNLYLAREGLIREGTEAAEGVSAHDMNVRASLQRSKKITLKDLTMFVSPTRLCIHNLPFSADDAELRAIFKKHGPKKSVITECRVMRDKKNGNVSKGFGFVAFSRHEDALEALRNINNNPTIFTATRRPIVEFSIENKLALQAREKRLSRSKEKQTNAKKSEENPPKTPEGKEDTADQSAKELSKREKKRLKSLKRFQKRRERKRIQQEGNPETNPPEGNPETNPPEGNPETNPPEANPVTKDRRKEFVGAKSDPRKKGNIGLPTHDGPKVRHKPRPTSISRKLLRKQQKNPPKKPRQPEIQPEQPAKLGKRKNNKAEIRQEPKKKQPRTLDRSAADFQAMVDRYKAKITSNASSSSAGNVKGKSKWFDS